jgi:futalosine hydrolase
VRRILIVTAVEAERAAIERGLSGLSDELRASSDVAAGGVGAAAVAATTAATLARAEYEGAAYDVVVSAGIGGAFVDAARLGDLLVAERIVVADLGADAPEGFLSVEELGFGTTTYAALPLEHLKPGAVSAFDVVRGDLLTVNTATGTAERTAWLRSRHPDAIGEAMEGYGVAVAAARFGLPTAEVRAVSNLIGPRDRGAWRIGEALATLTSAAAPIVEGLAL